MTSVKDNESFAEYDCYNTQSVSNGWFTQSMNYFTYCTKKDTPYEDLRVEIEQKLPHKHVPYAFSILNKFTIPKKG